MSLYNYEMMLQELIYARGPCGQEEEVRNICLQQFLSLCDETWIDSVGNVIGKLNSDETSNGVKNSYSIKILAHMDEISMIVKRVEKDGLLRVNNLGGLRPVSVGQIPVEILATNTILPGVLSHGSQHTTHETSNAYVAKTKLLDWSNVCVYANMTKEELLQFGVHPGTRVVIARQQRTLFHVGDCIAGYFMDDRAAITACLQTLYKLKNRKKELHHDIYFVMTCEEEMNGTCAAYATSQLPPGPTIGIEVGPVASEYDIKLRPDPIVAYADSRAVYNKSLADMLLAKSNSIGQKPQTAVWEHFCSDTSIAKSYGQADIVGLVCIPTINTHGYEIIHRQAIPFTSQLLFAFITDVVQSCEFDSLITSKNR
jgi:putative aminopeptidase FrvX